LYPRVKFAVVFLKKILRPISREKYFLPALIPKVGIVPLDQHITEIPLMRLHKKLFLIQKM
jgi:hypothetical protein